MSFRDESVKLTKSLSLSVKKQYGIYFTPKEIRQKLLSFIDIIPSNILEPSFGSGEFIYDVIERYPNAQIDGVELNQDFYNNVRKNMTSNKISLYNEDFLNFESSHQYDLVIGNPPYVVTKVKNQCCYNGRGNLFVLFIYLCLTKHVKKDGILAFIIPTSFMNCVYYEPCRKYIYDNCRILYAETITDGKWLDTCQKTMILIIKNEVCYEKPYFMRSSGYFITEHVNELSDLMSNSKNLKELGLSVRTGQIIWNEHKDDLIEEDGILLIYDTNLVGDGKLKLNNLSKGEKKQMIRRQKVVPMKGPALLIARGFGNNYKLRYALIPEETIFYGENHVNVITGNRDILNLCYESLGNNKTKRFIELFVGNGALSKTDIEKRLPFFL